MKRITRVIIAITTIMFLFGAMPIVTPVGNKAEAGGYFKKHKWVTTKDLARDHDDLEDKINMLKDSTEVLEQNQTMMKQDIATILENLMNGGGGGAVTGASPAPLGEPQSGIDGWSRTLG